MRRATIAILLLAVFAPAPAAAQTVGDIPYVDAVDAWADAQQLRRVLPEGKTGTTKPSRTKKRRPPQPSARQLAALRFERTPEVRQQNYQAVMALLEPGYDPAALVAEFDRVLNGTHGSMRDFDVRMSPTNIADVAAWEVLSAYAAFYDRAKLSNRGVRAVRDAVRRSLALEPQARRASDAETQRIAEMLELRTILRISDLYWARTNGDAAGAQLALDELSSWIDDLFGVDLERVRLSAKGLVPR